MTVQEYAAFSGADPKLVARLLELAQKHAELSVFMDVAAGFGIAQPFRVFRNESGKRRELVASFAEEEPAMARLLMARKRAVEDAVLRVLGISDAAIEQALAKAWKK